MMKKTKYNASKKKMLLVSTIATLVVLVGVYGYISYASWDNVHRATEHDNTQMAQMTKKFFADKSTTNSDGRKAIIKKIANAPSGSCMPNGFIAWQSNFIRGAKDSIKKCQGDTAKRNAVSKQANQIFQFYEDQAKMASILKNMRFKDKSLSPSSYEKSLESVTKISKIITIVSFPSEGFAEVKDETGKRLHAIEKVWKTLIKADKAENRTNFEKATTQLAKEYDNLDTIPKKVSTAYASEIESLSSSVDAL